MQPLNHPDPNFRLVSAETMTRPSRKVSPKVWLTMMLALALILAAFYAPVLWNNQTINAAPGARLLQAQALQVDASLLQDQEALAQLYTQVAPSVVNIQVAGQAMGNVPDFQFPDIPGFPDLPEGEIPQQRGEGSGFIYDNEGHIVTNNHVVDGAEEVVVVFNNGHWATAEVVATDPQADLAVIKVTPPSGVEWRPLPLAEPSNIKVGHTVVAFGNPFGMENTMTTGIVSAMGRGMPVGVLGASRYTLPDVIQTDAAINPGNSGGPLVNLAGEVVGVNFAIESATRSNSGVGFTIPVSIVRRVVPALIANGKFDYAYLGLSGITISPDMGSDVISDLGFSSDTLGVYVGSVVPNGPADQAGVHGGNNAVSTNGDNNLQAGGDIITAINDQPVQRFEDLVSFLVTQAEPGQTVTLTLLRDGQEVKLDVMLGTRPGLQEAEQVRIEGPVSPRQAIEIATDAVRDSLDGPVTETLVSPDRQGGQDVWIVELSTDSQKATVIVSQETGEVLELSVD
jgi:2-alkenal reductase